MSNIESGERVATAISGLKWVLIALAILGAVVTVAGIALEDNSVSYAVTAATIAAAATCAWCLVIWVLFGWFEHTLRALVTIARNTSGPVAAVPPPYQQKV